VDEILDMIIKISMTIICVALAASAVILSIWMLKDAITLMFA